MDIQILTNLVSNVGFPIAVAVYMIVQNFKLTAMVGRFERSVESMAVDIRDLVKNTITLVERTRE